MPRAGIEPNICDVEPNSSSTAPNIFHLSTINTPLPKHNDILCCVYTYILTQLIIKAFREYHEALKAMQLRQCRKFPRQLLHSAQYVTYQRRMYWTMYKRKTKPYSNMIPILCNTFRFSQKTSFIIGELPSRRTDW